MADFWKIDQAKLTCLESVKHSSHCSEIVLRNVAWRSLQDTPWPTGSVEPLSCSIDLVSTTNHIQNFDRIQGPALLKALLTPPWQSIPFSVDKASELLFLLKACESSHDNFFRRLVSAGTQPFVDQTLDLGGKREIQEDFVRTINRGQLDKFVTDRLWGEATRSECRIASEISPSSRCWPTNGAPCRRLARESFEASGGVRRSFLEGFSPPPVGD